MNRTDMIREVLALEGIASAARMRADAIRAELEHQARQEYQEQGSAVTWRVPEVAQVTMPLSRRRVEVVSQARFAEWVAKRYPDRGIDPRPVVLPGFQTEFLARVDVIADGDEDGAAIVADPDTGEALPGVTVRPGGLPMGLRFTPERDAKAAYALLGQKLLDDALERAAGPVVVS